MSPFTLSASALVVLAQSPPGANPFTRFWLPIIGVTIVVLGLLAMVASRQRKRGTQDRLKHLAGQYQLEEIQSQDELERLSQTISRLFNEVAMYVRELTLFGALRKRLRNFEVEIVHAVLGFEASNANHQTLDKIVVLVSDFDTPLPGFKLMPNNWMFRQIHPERVFAAKTPFAQKNLVLGDDHQRIKQIMNDEFKEAMSDNRELVIHSIDGTLAFYLHDDRVEPDDLERFTEHCVTLAAILQDQARQAPAEAGAV